MSRITTRTLTLVDLNESVADWDSAGSDVTLTASKTSAFPSKDYADNDGFTVIGSVKIPSYESWAIGHPYGIGLGVVYLRLDSSAAQIHGKVRIKVCSPTYDRSVNEHEHNTRAQGANPTDRLNQVVKHIETITRDKIYVNWFKPDSHVILLFKPETDGAIIDVSDANNACLIPISVLPANTEGE